MRFACALRDSYRRLMKYGIASGQGSADAIAISNIARHDFESSAWHAVLQIWWWCSPPAQDDDFAYAFAQEPSGNSTADKSCTAGNGDARIANIDRFLHE
jgi:hypothetical protein